MRAARVTPGDTVSVPNPSQHPDPETLMLWESGELDSEASNIVKLHVQECRQCEETVERFSAVYEEVAGVKAAAASWNLRDTVNTKEQERRRKRRSSLQWITIGTAATVALVFAVSTLFNLTPAAKAETLLLTASQREAAHGSSKNFLKLARGGLQCRMIADSHGTRTIPISNSSAALCDSAITHFRRAGWQSGNLLSAKSFRQWRDSLSEKTDTILEQVNTTAITTKTEMSPLRKATLELRNADYEPIAARFEFASSDSGPTEAFEVTESDESFNLADSAIDPKQLPAIPQPGSSVTVDASSVDPLDFAEARVRMALHQLDLDRSVLVAVERKENTVRVWGLVAQPQTLSELREAVSEIPQAQFAVVSEDNGPLPWSAYQGSGSPLASEKIAALFPNNPQGRQEFINALDLFTRRVVGAARSREKVLKLAVKIGSSEQAALLRQSASELRVSISADLESIAKQLQLLTDEPLVSSADHVSASRAMDLYLRVHEVVFLGRPDRALTLEQAIADIRSLLQ